MHKDEKQLSEAYTLMLEKAEHCKYAVEGHECEECDECMENKRKHAEKNNSDNEKQPVKKKTKVKESVISTTSKFDEAYNDVLNWFE